MIRWLVAMALSCSLWAVQQPGVAHARAALSSELGIAMCSEGSQTVLPEGFAFGRALSTVLPSAAPVVNDDEGPPAWCISPDDPRCTPRDQGAPLQSQRAHTPMQHVAAIRFPELAFGRGLVTLRPQQLGAPLAGVAQLLERPPRC